MIDLSNIRLFVFYFDGTLVQSNAIKRNAFYDIARQYAGASALLDDLLKAKPPLDRYGICRGLAERFDGADATALADAYTALCNEQIAVAPQVPGALRLLAALQDRGRFCAVNSATPEAALRALVARLPVAFFVQAVLGAPTSKADNVRRAMEIAGVNAQQTVMVGDSPADQHAAAENSCAFVGVGTDKANFSPPVPMVVSRLDELIKWL